MKRFDIRPGERRLEGSLTSDAYLCFIGVIRSPWSFETCPKNIRAARETGQSAQLEVLAPFRPALSGVEAGMGLVLLYWMDGAPRDLVQQAPRHRDGATGTFNLRSPARPNPLGRGTVRVLGIDHEAGLVTIDAIDAVDGTKLVDIKPHLPSVDTLPA